MKNAFDQLKNVSNEKALQKVTRNNQNDRKIFSLKYPGSIHWVRSTFIERRVFQKEAL